MFSHRVTIIRGFFLLLLTMIFGPRISIVRPDHGR